jgi:hypothetical protein
LFLLLVAVCDLWDWNSPAGRTARPADACVFRESFKSKINSSTQRITPKTTNHFALVALLVLGATLCASARVRAGDDWGTMDLASTNNADAPDYGASGMANLTNVTFQGFGYIGAAYGEIYAGDLSVTAGIDARRNLSDRAGLPRHEDRIRSWQQVE